MFYYLSKKDSEGFLLVFLQFLCLHRHHYKMASWYLNIMCSYKPLKNRRAGCKMRRNVTLSFCFLSQKFSEHFPLVNTRNGARGKQEWESLAFSVSAVFWPRGKGSGIVRWISELGKAPWCLPRGAVERLVPCAFLMSNGLKWKSWECHPGKEEEERGKAWIKTSTNGEELLLKSAGLTCRCGWMLNTNCYWELSQKLSLIFLTLSETPRTLRLFSLTELSPYWRDWAFISYLPIHHGYSRAPLALY